MRGSLVSVIVPAWNARSTLHETLASAAAQTHGNLEILIVDDGSADATADIAAAFCASEPRARLIRQQNLGVAAARNRAIDQASGDFIAPLDADDVWHPEKIERQLQTFAESSPRAGLVYCWYRTIDEQSQYIDPPWTPVMAGSVFREHLKLNFGTGSSPLIRRGALGHLRYDPELQQAGNQGCEDWLLQLKIAAEHDIACTRAFLLGYRQSRSAMSSDKERMIRSHIQMYEIIARDLPGRETRTVKRELARWQAKHALIGGRWSELARAFSNAPLVVAREVLTS